MIARLIFALFLITINFNANAIELHPFLYIGATLTNSQQEKFFERSKEQRFFDEAKTRQMLGITILYKNNSISLSTNRLTTRPLSEQILIHNHYFTTTTKQTQDNIVFSHKMNDILGLSCGLSRVKYEFSILQLHQKIQNQFYAGNIGFNVKLAKPVYMLFSYSPRFLNNYSQENIDYYGAGVIMYFL